MRFIKKFCWFLLGAFTVLNVFAIFHAYRFTHVSESGEYDARQPEELSWMEKVEMLVSGPPNHRKPNHQSPKYPFEEVIIKGSQNLHCWYIPVDSAIGNVALFHGYKSNKSALLERAYFFRGLGYNTLLMDFEGAGDSEGNRCTIGYYESLQVHRAVEWIDQNSSGPIILFGNSMGAAAAMKFSAERGDKSKRTIPMILECPFNSLYETTQARFHSMNLPSFPFAELLVFWGGTMNGFNGFDHNPIEYAKEIRDPILFLHGSVDDRVTVEHMEEIVASHTGESEFHSFKGAGHSDYLENHQLEWQSAVADWLKRIES